MTIAAATLLPPLRPNAATAGKWLWVSASLDSAAPTKPTGTPTTPPPSRYVQANGTGPSAHYRKQRACFSPPRR
ncbi:hypothetical protein LFZ89_08485 [Salmonella enterica subsp. enterica serovar Gallinarum]|nr:hypothetical protein OI20_17725 [Salmonella enterica subsp. enterica serovar Gallinarum]KSB00187.1 hypothetical protein LFZ89_08485 [Salmonella enterica subsp. enterica serovar Gallinarum]